MINESETILVPSIKFSNLTAILGYLTNLLWLCYASEIEMF